MSDQLLASEGNNFTGTTCGRGDGPSVSTTQIAKQCPRWSRCSVNNCPLDAHMTHPDDKERKCPMEKGVRVRIAAKYPGELPMHGMTTREWAGKAAFDSKPLAVRLAMIEKGKASLARLRASNELNSDGDNMGIVGDVLPMPIKAGCNHECDRSPAPHFAAREV
jgi:hypothetical protein